VSVAVPDIFMGKRPVAEMECLAELWAQLANIAVDDTAGAEEVLLRHRGLILPKLTQDQIAEMVWAADVIRRLVDGERVLGNFALMPVECRVTNDRLQIDAIPTDTFEALWEIARPHESVYWLLRDASYFLFARCACCMKIFVRRGRAKCCGRACTVRNQSESAKIMRRTRASRARASQ
jgi:hypothetical protein